MALLPSSSAVALTSVRIAAAVRPWRPITRPRSPCAMNSSTSVCPRCVALRHANRVGPVGQRAGHDLDDVARAAHDAGCSAGRGHGAGGIRDTSVRTVSDGRAPVFSQ